MESLEIIKDYLDEKNVENNMQSLPNGVSVLVVKSEGNFYDHELWVEELSENENELRINAIVSTTCKEAKYNVCRIINDYNRKYDYVKFIYQESEQGEVVLASCAIPSLSAGLTWYFNKVLENFISVLDDVKYSIPSGVFNGQVKYWFFGND